MAALAAPSISARPRAALGAPRGGQPARFKAKARAAQDFEAVFLNAMFSQMFTGDRRRRSVRRRRQGRRVALVPHRGIFAKSFAKAGGIGIAADDRIKP